VFTEHRGASSFHDEAFVRGVSFAPRFLDGLKSGTGSFARIDPYLLERVGLVKGPSSIFHGQDSPGGLVNLVSRTSTGETGGEVQATAGAASRIGPAADIRGTFDKAGELAWRAVATAAGVDTQEDKLEEQGFSVAPSLTWRPDSGRSLTVSAIASHDPEAGFRTFRAAAGSITPTSHGCIPREFRVTDPDIDESERTQLSAGWRYEQALGDGLTLRSNAGISNTSSACATLTRGSLQADEVTISRTGSGGRGQAAAAGRRHAT
jgi:iron complex outermembrane receptor protein